MSDLKDDILKDEEIFGGFTNSELDDDTFLSQNRNLAGSKQDDIVANKIGTEQNIHDDPDKIKNNSRNKFSLIAITAAVALLLLTISALLILLPQQEKDTNPKNLSNSDNSNSVENLQESNITESNENHNDILNHSSDTLFISEEDDFKNDNEFSNSENLNANELPITKDQNSEIVTKEKQNSKSNEPKLAEELIIKDLKQATKEKTTSDKTKSKLTNNIVDDIVNSNALTEAKPNKVKEEQIIKVTAIDETFQPKDIQGLYIVQIYSSPSRDDAQVWLDKLRSKNVPDAFISEQSIRDKKWYRVRFGKFITREEARSAALRFGFAQSWIDRVK